MSPWTESFDYRYTTTALNNETAKRSEDGSWRLVVAPEDPAAGVVNWLDTGGRLEGCTTPRVGRWPTAPRTRAQKSSGSLSLSA